MRVDLKILHLQRPILYEKVDLESSLLAGGTLSRAVPMANHGETIRLEDIASQWKECLISFWDEDLFSSTDDGPRLAHSVIENGLVPSAVYRVAAAAQPGSPREAAANACFSMPAADYVFFQWRSMPELAAVIEEFAREIWWQRLETEGPWFLRLVWEDGEIAMQALRTLKRQ